MSNLESVCSSPIIPKEGVASCLKGREFAETFDLLGNGILNSYSESWRSQRKLAKSTLNDGALKSTQAEVPIEKVEKELIPLLAYMARKNKAFNMQDLFMGLEFHTTCMHAHGVNLRSLFSGFQTISFTKAIDEAQACIAPTLSDAKEHLEGQ